MSHRYGISLGVSPREPLSRVSEIAAAVDAGGFDALWYIDFQLGMKDVYAAMNLAALATENVQIGSAVTNLVTRHPTVTANATAALDELSDGRALLGLGAGWSAVLGAGGQPSTLGDIRGGIDELRQLFTGDEVDLYGTTVQLAAATRQVPIYLAVSQPGMLRLAGEVCDGAILMGAADPEFCRWQLDYIAEGLERAGRSRAELTIDLMVTMSWDDDQQQALDDVIAQSSLRLERWLAAEQSSPSHAAQREDDDLRVAAALAELPEAQQDAVILRYWQELPIAEIAVQMERSPEAVAGLLQRGARSLRERLSR